MRTLWHRSVSRGKRPKFCACHPAESRSFESANEWGSRPGVVQLPASRKLQWKFWFNHMFGLFRRKWTFEETAKAFPEWERSVTVCLFTKLQAELIAKGLPNETSAGIAAQGVNYITGVDWEASVSNASAKIKSLVEAHKSEIEPAIRALLAKDKSCREIVVYFLRIKTVFLAAHYGFDVWVKNPMYERIWQILSMYGREFPEEADPGKFCVMVLNFHHKIYPPKHA
jgi:hypothetical protein